MSNIMKSGSPFDHVKQVDDRGEEFWSARDLMPLLGYGTRWQNFDSAVDRVKASIENQNMDVTSHVTDASKKVARPQGGSV